jgi:hypothetical protein
LLPRVKKLPGGCGIFHCGPSSYDDTHDLTN